VLVNGTTQPQLASLAISTPANANLTAAESRFGFDNGPAAQAVELLI
jgi:hypothetical protein